jgi:hypothetical protein
MISTAMIHELHDSRTKQLPWPMKFLFSNDSPAAEFWGVSTAMPAEKNDSRYFAKK